MADIPQELATLLGRPGAVSIRRTDERPPRLSAIDVSILVTGKDARKTAQDIGYVKERFPEVARNLGLYKFPGRRQRETPVANIRGAIELVLLLPGRHAARVRREAASLLDSLSGGRSGARRRDLQEPRPAGRTGGAKTQTTHVEYSEKLWKPRRPWVSSNLPASAQTS